jgi:hypothetical protein
MNAMTQEREPEPEMAPYREDPGEPDTGRPAEFPAEAWPPPNPGAPDPRRPLWSHETGDHE